MKEEAKMIELTEHEKQVKATLLRAINRRDLNVAKLHINVLTPCNSSKFLNDAMVLAAVNGDLDIFTYTISCGAKMDYFGYAALRGSAAKGNKDIVEYIITNGKTTLKSSDIKEALKWAHLFNQKPMFNYLMDQY